MQPKPEHLFTLATLNGRTVEAINAHEIADGPDYDLDGQTIAQDKIEEAAKLPLAAYEKQRKEIAKSIGIRATVLDSLVKKERAGADTPNRPPSLQDVEPWSISVPLATVLDNAVVAYRRFLILPEGAAEIMAAWSFITHAFTCFNIVPRLCITSADKGCAKSLTLRVLKCTSAMAVVMTNANIAPLFRVISHCRPTIFLDEADNYLKDNPSLLGLLNDGHAAGGVVWRCEGDNNEVKEFQVFAPVAIAMIDRPKDTLLSRSIEIRMQRKTAGEKTENFRGDRDDRPLIEIQRMFARCATDYGTALRETDPNMANLINRDADNWRPMFAVADVAGGQWPARMREIAGLKNKERNDESTREKLLHDIRDIFETLGVDRMPSVVLADALGKIETRPWSEWKNGKPITATGLARQLAPFGVHPGSRRDGEEIYKGYLLSDFKDAFTRYPPIQTVTPSQPNNHGHCVGLQTVTADSDVTVSKASQPNNYGHCDGVTLSKGVDPDGWTFNLDEGGES